MEFTKISQSEVELAKNAVTNIINAEIQKHELTGELPEVNEISDSNTVYTKKISMLFVDMRDSTKLSLNHDYDEIIKIYRSFIRILVQSIRYNDGSVRNFTGDGVLAAFIDTDEANSEDKAVIAARYITTLINKILNPLLYEKFSFKLSCGIGIHTGYITLTKVGMRGKDQDQETPDYDLVWLGDSTNYASKFSDVVANSDIFISKSTYENLSDFNKTDIWTRYETVKGKNLLSGYITKEFYLDIEEDLSPVVSNTTSTSDESLNEFNKVFQNALNELLSESKELGMKENELNSKAEEVENTWKRNKELERKLNNKIYNLYRHIFSKAWLNDTFTKGMREIFFENCLRKLISAGEVLDKTEKQVKSDTCVYLVDIYSNLENWEKAYEYLVIQAKYNSWIHLSTVKKVVGKWKRNYRLKSAIEDRLENNSVKPENKKEFQNILKYLESL